DRVKPIAHVVNETDRAIAHAGYLTDANDRIQNLRQGLRLDGQDDSLGRGRLLETAYGGRDLLVPDRTDFAQLLGDDEVGITRLQRRVVEHVEAAAPVRRGGDVSVDVPAGQRVRGQRAACDGRNGRGARGNVAFVRYRDNVIAESEGKQDVRGAGKQ